MEPLLILGLAEKPAPHPSFIWDVLDSVMPRLESLRALGEHSIPPPDILRVRSLTRRTSVLIASRERVAILGSIDAPAEPQRITHWHNRTLEKTVREGSSLSTLRRRLVFERRDLSHLSYWLEEELPAKGLDYLGIDLRPRHPFEQLVLPPEEDLRTLAGAASSILWEILKDAAGENQANPDGEVA